MKRNKSAFTVVEVLGVVFILLLIVGITLPLLFTDFEQAKAISKWKITYDDAQYSMKLFNIQQSENVQNICRSNQVDKSEEILRLLVPYFNVQPVTKKGGESSYSYKFMNSRHVSPRSRFYTTNFMAVDDGMLIGLKWENCGCDEKTFCGYLLFDINGFEPPNRFGKDIFGVNIFKDSIKAFGAGFDEYALKKGCSNLKRGVYCSEYYLQGGQFY